MNNPFNHLLLSLSSLSRETAILELCDWDQDKKAALQEHLGKELSGLKYFSLEKIEEICFNQNITSEQSKSALYDIIIEMVQVELQQISKTEYEN